MSMSSVQSPINIEKWIEENAEKFKPPVSNRYLYDGRDFFVMVIKGPNARNDFHLVDSEEYFYQLKGDIKVRIREGDRIVGPDRVPARRQAVGERRLPSAGDAAQDDEPTGCAHRAGMKHLAAAHC